MRRIMERALNVHLVALGIFAASCSAASIYLAITL